MTARRKIKAPPESFLPPEKRYPTFYLLAHELANKAGRDIMHLVGNHKWTGPEAAMPYKAQALLEYLIRDLEKRV